MKTIIMFLRKFPLASGFLPVFNLFVVALVLLWSTGFPSAARAETPEFAWLVQYGTIGNANEAVNFVYAYNGYIYVTGFTVGVLGTSNAGGQDIFIRRISSNDVVTLQFGTTGNDVANTIFVDDTGVYVGGLTTGTLPGQTSQGGQDAFVARLDHTLNAPPSWINQFGSPNSDSVEDLEGDGTAVYAVGQTGGALIQPRPPGTGGTDAFLIKFSTNGTEAKRTQFGTTANQDIAFGVAVIVIDGSTQIYVAGAAGESLSGQTYQGGAGDSFVRHYNSDLVEGWTRLDGTASFDRAFGVTACPDGGLGVPGGVYTTGVDPLPDSNPYVRKFNFNTDDSDTINNPIWHKSFGNPVTTDFANEISCSSSMVAVVGTTGGAFPPNVNTGGFDIFAASLNPATGDLMWGGRG